jgi:hypothetical protein
MQSDVSILRDNLQKSLPTGAILNDLLYSQHRLVIGDCDLADRPAGEDRLEYWERAWIASLGEIHGTSAIASDDVGTGDRFEVDGGGVVWVVGVVGRSVRSLTWNNRHTIVVIRYYST